ncbi:alpha/beta hydrolase [Sphingomonas donggukensis]|uniref:Palmitoyl-protein thioesterase ABHD10, mitochondrial n=1 Tax=Sphingomonas donggukensis TaxID=2949093 RepID=A0ABY4TVY2_9SPHN|nr:alpha/beta hydrolase [Sphingomonas donggukensis]URW74691.1 alpha/beta hydrolase [Sphingomonas donggukensis]
MTRPLAHHNTPGTGPTLVFLPGYASDMTGSKALAVEGWARARGRAALRFDYAGCGDSPGAFEDYTLADWRDDALAMIDRLDGPVTLIGSSMGGWIALLAALARPQRVAHIVGIAPAPDFTEWGFSDAEKAALARDGRVERASEYGPEPTVFTRAFHESGQALRLTPDQIAIDCPVRFLQGQRDADVPWQRTVDLAARLRSADVQTLLVKDGDHRLSRDADIALLLGIIESLP